MALNGRKSIAIVGGGVVGLTCASCMPPEFVVTVIADKIGFETDSRNATAIWHVYLVPETERVLSWAQRTLEKLLDLNAHDPSAGIELVNGIELFRTGKSHVPKWAHIPPEFRLLAINELAEFNELDVRRLDANPALANNPVRWGYKLRAPATDMSIYLPWLQRDVEAKGCQFVRQKLVSLNELAHNYDIIINCSGFGARELVSDAAFLPYKGQYFVLRSDTTAPSEYLGDDDHPGGMAYVIPRGREVLVGGCAEVGVEDLKLTLDWEDVKQRAGLYVPWLRTRTVSDQARAPVVCIRPARKNGVRLEVDYDICDVPVVHNYGHGGSGFSLAWGCAGDVADIVRSV